MQIRRTACAGVLLELDGFRFLLDGVGREVKPYPATPPEIRQQLEVRPPDALLITHKHLDHYDSAFVTRYDQNSTGPILGPADVPGASQEPLNLGPVKITPVNSRHIGKSDGTKHMSFILQGSVCIWFLGDSSPLFWKNPSDLPKPDVLIVPYAYGMGSGWDLCKSLGARAVVLLHLPKREADSYGLWNAVMTTVGQGGGPAVYIPQMGDEVSL